MDELNELLRRQADELRLSPAPAVWMRVEADIARRERRRRLFFWLLGAGLLLASLLAYGLFNRPGTSHGKGVMHPTTTRPQPVITHQTNEPPAILDASDENSIRQKARKPDRVKPDVPATPSTTVGQSAVSAVQPIHPVKTTAPGVKTAVRMPLKHAYSPAALPAIRVEPGPVPSLQPSASRVSKQPASIAVKHHDMSLLPVEWPALPEPETALTSLAPIHKSMQHSVPQQRGIDLPMHQPVAVPSVRAEREPLHPAPPLSPVATDASLSRSLVSNPLQASVSKPLQVEVKTEAEIADSTVPTDGKPGRWTFAAAITPLKNQVRFEEQTDSQFIRKRRGSSSLQPVTFNCGITAGYAWSPRLEVWSGLGIRTFGEDMRALQDTYREDSVIISNPTGNVPRRFHQLIGKDSAALIRNRITYLEVPLGLRFRLLQSHRISWYLYGDIGISRLISASGYYYDYNKDIYQPVDKKRLAEWLPAYGFGTALQYRFTSRVAIEAAPEYHASPSSIYKADGGNKLQAYYRQWGVQFILRYTPYGRR